MNALILAASLLGQGCPTLCGPDITLSIVTSRDDVPGEANPANLYDGGSQYGPPSGMPVGGVYRYWLDETTNTLYVMGDNVNPCGAKPTPDLSRVVDTSKLYVDEGLVNCPCPCGSETFRVNVYTLSAANNNVLWKSGAVCSNPYTYTFSTTGGFNWSLAYTKDPQNCGG
jgi:hypothetical protein